MKRNWYSPVVLVEMLNGTMNLENILEAAITDVEFLVEKILEEKKYFTLPSLHLEKLSDEVNVGQGETICITLQLPHSYYYLNGITTFTLTIGYLRWVFFSLYYFSYCTIIISVY